MVGELEGMLARTPDLVAAFVTAAVAVAVLRASPRKPANQFFGLFMLLIAGNFLAGFVQYGLVWAWGRPNVEGFVVGRVGARLALQFLILDPPVLLYFALLYPRRHEMLDRAWVRALILVPPVLLTVLHLAAPGLLLEQVLRYPWEGGLDVTPWALDAYVGVFYIASFALMLRSLKHESSPLVHNQLGLLVVGFGVAVLPRLGLVPVPLLQGLFQAAIPWGPLGAFAIRAGVTLAFFEMARRYLGTAGDPGLADQRRRYQRVLLGLLALIIAVWGTSAAIGSYTEAGGQGGPGTLVGAIDLPLGSLVFSLRWIVFGLVVGYALLKYQVFDVGPRVRRLARAGASGAVLLAVAGLALGAGSIAAPVTQALSPGMVLALVAILVAAPFALRWAGRAAEQWVPHRAPGDAGGMARRLEMYRASLEGAMRDGKVRADAEQELRELRRDLGISDEQHRVLLEVARLDAAGKGRGPVLAGNRLAGRYELGEVLGQGSFGRCRLARDALLGRTVVVKEVPVLPGEDRAVLREARAAGRLNHPNIVTVHDVIETPGLSYLVMEHADGGNLRDRLARGRVPQDEALRFLRDVLAGLEAAHGRDIVHGDIKPENILLTSEGRAKLADFGSAHSTSQGTMVSLPTRAGPGTLLYMAPEQVLGEAPTKASDLYALAAIAHEVLAGRHYVEVRGKSDLDLREAIVRGTPQIPDELPRPLAGWLARGLAKDPVGRWTGAGEMAAALPSAETEPMPRRQR